MSIVDVLIFFLVLWWPIFFILLPIGYEPITKYDEKTEYVRSAPNKPKVIKKIILSSIISLFITIIVWLLDYNQMFSLKEVFL